MEKDLFWKPEFKNRGIAFWAWNTEVTDVLVMSQIDIMARMGFGGFCIHPRTGLKTEYMGHEYMRLVRLANEYGKQKGLTCWLYDEDRYSSGTAGGRVTKNILFRKKMLLFSCLDRTDLCSGREEFKARCLEGDKPDGYYLSSYCITLENGRLREYKRCSRDEAGNDYRDCQIRHAYVVLMDESLWYNGQTYVDAMNKEAVKNFLECTHERYARLLGEEMGKSMPGFFTDEPNVRGKYTLTFAESREDVLMPFTDDFPETFLETYNYNLLDYLPELFLELPFGQMSQARYHFHDHVAERFAAGYCDTIGEWCEEHHVALTGHLLSECTLFQQTFAIGEAMRQYRAFQIPGIDILADQKEYSTAKQAVSVARQFGRRDVLSEIYGVTQWDADFKTYKLQGDWLAAMGITVRVPHLSFMSMEGEAKRDWPASIFYQSPWYEKYPLIEDHFARLNTILKKGRALCRVGVIHPIESYWTVYGPNDQTLDIRRQLDENYANVLKWLIFGLIDFDLISESMLSGQYCVRKGSFQIGCAEYQVILIPDCRVLRGTTAAALEEFVEQGGELVFAGHIPQFVDCVRSDRLERLANRTKTTVFTKEGILDCLGAYWDIQVMADNGGRSDNLAYQMREDGDCRWLFLCNVEKKKYNASSPGKYYLTIRGRWKVRLYDTHTGRRQDVCPSYGIDSTRLQLDMYAEDSMLFELLPCKEGEKEDCVESAVRVWPAEADGNLLIISQPGGFRLIEPNVLLLDYAQAAVDEEEFSDKAEILRIDNDIRRRLDLPLRGENVAAWPWQDGMEEVSHRVRLRYEFYSDIALRGCWLAMEHPEQAEIHFNGEEVSLEDGWYVDWSIKKLVLPEIVRGRNIIEIGLPFGRNTNLESIYILGNFGVELGPVNKLIAFPKNLAFGDITRQRLPFYTGNVIYESGFVLNEPGDISIKVPYFSNSVLEVFIDGRHCGLIAFQPHFLTVEKLEQGRHKLEICAFGNRFNTFGTLHNSNPDYLWFGPDSYRTTGDQWSEYYLVRPAGILSRVEICGNVSTDRNLPESHRENVAVYQNRMVQKMTDYLKTHYQKDISLQDLADLCNVNTNYAGNLFKSETGEPFIKYLTRLRMERAEILLKSTEGTVAEIAAMVGYNDYFYFAKVFKKYAGMTPTEYRGMSRSETARTLI